jgi:hypothetical protein
MAASPEEVGQVYYGMNGSEKRRCQPVHFNNLRAVTGMSEEDHLACLVSEARLPHTRRTSAVKSRRSQQNSSDFTAGRSTTTIDRGNSRPALSQSISKNPAMAPSAHNRMKENLYERENECKDRLCIDDGCQHVFS